MDSMVLSQLHISLFVQIGWYRPNKVLTPDTSGFVPYN